MSNSALSLQQLAEATVASSCSINYLGPGQLGDMLTATAEECCRRSHTGIYDITVHHQNGY